MKRLFFYAPTTKGGGIAPVAPVAPVAEVAPVVYDSPALQDIRAKIDANLAETPTDRTAKIKQSTELFKLTEQESAEIANIKQAQRLAEVELAKQAKIAKLSTLLDMASGDRSTTEFKTAFDEIANQLTGSVKAAPKSEGSETGSHVTRKEIVEKHLAYLAAGKTESDSRKLLETVDGYKKSTIWHAINDYKIAQA